MKMNSFKRKRYKKILHRYSIFASSEDEKIQLDKWQFIRAIQSKNIQWASELLSIEDFVCMLKDFLKQNGDGDLSFFFFCDYIKKNKTLKVSCIQDERKLEKQYNSFKTKKTNKDNNNEI